VQGLPLRVGVDLAALAELPAEASLEWAAFRKENFAAAELAYAAGRPEPRVTLLGLWAAKEAVLKCGWAGRLRPRDVTHYARLGR
jgi:phosphopantetheinyl transferase (holo-ACP synthase)